MEELYKAAGIVKGRVLSKGVGIIDDALEIRRIQRLTAERWKTSHFSLLLSLDPHVWVQTTGEIYACWYDDELILHFDEKEMETVRDVHSYLME
ncbi:hypothetical protein [Archaeoglobus sp.]